MGKTVELLALERGWTVRVLAGSRSSTISEQDAAAVDVGIHFANGSAVANHVEQWARLRKPLVIGTTGWADSLEKVRSTVETSGIGVVYGANFSPGVHLFTRLVTLVGTLADRADEYDVGIHESHHKEKADSPSGTALMLAGVLLERIRRKSELLKEPPHGPRKPEQLQVSSIRVGTTIGSHSVILDSPADTIELTHKAKNRAGFALGALLAAEWIQTKTGFHSVDEVMHDFLDS